MNAEPQKPLTKAAMLSGIRKSLVALAKAPPANPSAKEMVRESLPQILEARRHGRSTAEIAGILTQHGVRITPATLAAYLREMTRNASGSDAAQDSHPDGGVTEEDAPSEAGSGGTSSIIWRPFDDGDDEVSARIDRMLAARQKDIRPEDLDRLLSEQEDQNL